MSENSRVCFTCVCKSFTGACVFKDECQLRLNEKALETYKELVSLKCLSLLTNLKEAAPQLPALASALKELGHEPCIAAAAIVESIIGAIESEENKS